MPVTTTNMSLTKWSSLSDRFDYQELSDNFEAIDNHDHVPLPGGGGGVQIPYGGLDVLSVGESNLRDESVSTQKIADGAVTTPKIDDDAVTSAKIADAAVQPAHLDPTVTSTIETLISDGEDLLIALSSPVGNWIDGTLTNGWVGPFRYYMDAAERVWIELGYPGYPAAGPVNVDDGCFRLPEGYRPDHNVWIPSYPGMVRVGPDGWVRPMSDALGFMDKYDDPEANISIAAGSFRVA